MSKLNVKSGELNGYIGIETLVITHGMLLRKNLRLGRNITKWCLINDMEVVKIGMDSNNSLMVCE
jgi:hypothetical protein